MSQSRNVRKRLYILPILFSGAAVMALGVSTAGGQSYPSKPIRMIVPGGSGNSFDVIARMITLTSASSLGQPVIVENRPAGVISGQLVAKSPADGYTLLYSGSSLWLGQYLQASTPYDVLRDFEPITQTTRSPTLLVVHPALPVKSVKDLIALARARPGALNYATGSTGSVSHLTAELFESMAGVRLVRVAYKSGAPALTDLIAGEVQLMFAVTGSVAPHMKSGRLKPLAVTSAERTALAAGVPTVAESGLPGFEAVSNAGIFAPAKTPRSIIDRLNQEIVRALGGAELKEKLLANGVEAVVGTPQQMESVVRAEMAKMGKVIKERGIREE